MPNVPCHSASLSDYDLYALPTKASHSRQWIHPSVFSQKKKSNEFTRSITPRNETLNPSHTNTNQPSRAPLVITCNPAFRSISTILQRHLKILSSSPRCNNVFQTTTLVAFRRTDNLSDILVRSKLRPDKQSNVTKGSFRCGKNYIT